VTLSALIWLTLLAAIATFWWHSDFVKNEALRQARAHCDRLGLQLLDYSMVIKAIFPVRDAQGSVRLRRKYRFEFTSTGEARYQGMIVMSGRRRIDIQLEPHILPSERSGESI
jgi:hypothetical protein